MGERFVPGRGRGSPNGGGALPAYKVAVGQRVEPAKVEAAKRLRREMTPAERVLWQHLRANRLHGLHFRRQQAIDGFIVDFYCHSAGLVVEVDGDAHDDQALYDQERTEILAARGLHVLRVRNEEVLGDIVSVLGTVLEACGRT